MADLRKCCEIDVVAGAGIDQGSFQRIRRIADGGAKFLLQIQHKLVIFSVDLGKILHRDAPEGAVKFFQFRGNAWNTVAFLWIVETAADCFHILFFPVFIIKVTNLRFLLAKLTVHTAGIQFHRALLLEKCVVKGQKSGKNDFFVIIIAENRAGE